MKHNFNRKILALILSAAMMLNSGAVAFAVEDGTAGEPTITASETVTATEEASSADTTTTPESKPESSSSEPQSSSSEQENAGGEQGDLSDPKGSDNALPGEGVKEPVCTCDPAPGASGVEGHQEDCPLYVPECTCPPVDSGEVVHKEGCPLYVAPPMMKAPRTADAITIKIKNGAEVGGDSLQAAVDNWRGTTYTYEAVTQLTITAGKVRASDWEWINILERLTEFTIEEGVTVEAIPDLSVNCIFSTTIEEVIIPQSIKIGSFAFNGCAALKTVNIPKATSIGANAFLMCIKLTRVSFPVATGIGEKAFSGCTELANTDFPTAATIGESAFNGCSLRTATFPAAASIGEKAFNACPSPRYLKLLDANGNALTGEALTAARTEYDVVDDGTEGYATDGLWYGWSIPAEPVTEDKITITVTDGTNTKTGIGGTGLEDAIAKSGLTASTIKTLTITAGEVKDTDWTYLKDGWLSSLTDFTIADTIADDKVADIPDSYTKVFPSTIINVSIPQPIKIGNYAFYQIKALKSVNFPAATSIGEYVFNSCTNLMTANLPAATSIGSKAFYECSTLATANFPAATSIGSNAFSGCTNLTTANFPAAASIGNNAFYSCSALETASFPAATSIDSVAFHSCQSLATLELGTTVPTVGSSAFTNCPTPRNLTVPAGAAATYDAVADGISGSTATDGLWYGWKVREPVTESNITILVNGTTTASGASLSDAVTASKVAVGSVKTLTITAGEVTTADWATVTKCKALTEFTIDAGIANDKVADIPNGEVNQSIFPSTIISVIIPQVKSIGKNAFYNCTKLTTTDFPAATTILNGAFNICKTLESVSFPAVTLISQDAFAYCYELKTAAFPAAVRIEDYAFRDCKILNTLELGASTPLVGTSVFMNCLETRTLIVPAGAAADYDAVTTGGNIANDGLWYGWKITGGAAESKITIKINGGSTDYKGDSLQAAITASNIPAGSVKTLTITAGELTAADWVWFKGTSGTSETPTPVLTALTDFTVDTAVTSVADIPDSTFGIPIFSKTIEKITIPQAIKIGAYAFFDSKLTSVNVSNATSIGKGAFNDCILLETANFPKATSIGENAFNGCNKLTSAIFPEVTTIEYGTFATCNLLKTVNIPKAASIGGSAFYQCYLLETVNFPKAASIGKMAFVECKKLTTAVFSAAVTIEDDAFFYCEKLATLTLGATPPASVGANAFSSCPGNRSLKLVKPDGTDLTGADLATAQGKYKTANDGNTTDDLWYGWKIGGGSVTVPVTGVTLNKSALSLEAGKSATLKATVEPATATNKAVTWKSSDTAVATVTDGLVSALKAGTATITVTTTDGNKTATCAVTVTAKTTGTAPGGKLEAPLTQPKIDEVFGDGNATLNPDGSIKINNDITVEKPIIVPAPITIDMGGKDMTGGAGANPVIKIDGGTGNGTITGGGSITGGDGGAGVEVGGGGTVIIGGGTVINGGDSSTGNGGSGITGDGSVVIGGGGSGSGGGSANGGNGGGSSGNGGDGVDVGGDIEIGSGGSATGGDGSGTGSGGDGVDTSGGSGGIIINGGGSSTGGNGGNNSSGTGGSGGNGATSGGGSIDVGDGASSEGGTGGNGSTAGGTGGNGTATGGTDTTIDGGATGGNGGNGTGNGNGGNGGDGAHQGSGEVDGSGSATGGNGGSGAGTGSGGSGGAGVGGGATVGDDLTVKNGISTKIEVTGDAGVKVELPNTKETVDAVLTDEEKADKTITDVKVTLKVDDKTADKPNKDAVETAKPSGSIVGAFFDITLKKTVTNGSGTITTDVTDTNSKMITITIEIPTGMRDGVTDSYVVIRVHNGTAAKLTTTQSGDNLTFNTDQFSTYAIAYTKNVTPPTPPTDNTGGGGNSSDNSEYDFWMSVKDKINNADSGDVIKVSAKTNDKMPESVMDALRKNPGVTLVISWSGGKTVTIPAGKAQKREAGRIYYPLSLLAELYQGIEYVEAPADIGKLNPETGGTGYIAYANGKQIPMTGGVAQLDAPAIDAPNAITPEAPAAITPPTAGFEPDAFAGTPDAARANSGNPFTVIALMLAAAAVGGGVWFWKKRREEEQSNET